VDSNKFKDVPLESRALLKDLSSSKQNSNHYERVIENTCDDLLELIDKKIDGISKNRGDGEVNEAVVTQGGRGVMKTDNMMRKPQH
jgi:hypothetical protein